MRRTTRNASAIGAILSLGLSLTGAGVASLQSTYAADAPAKPSPSASAQASAAANEAAAKHVKRTACLKDAKAKKLVGADKTAYVKNCVASP